MRPQWLRAGLVMGLMVGLLLIGFHRWSAADAAWRGARSLGLSGWLLGALGLLASHALRAGRLYGEWRPRRAVDALECLRVTLWHSAAVNLLPMRAGELGYPWLLHQRWGVPLVESAGSLFWMRVQDAVVLAWLGGLVLLALARQAGSLPTLPALLLAALLTALLFGVAVWRIAQAQRLQPRSWGWCVANWVAKLGTLAALMAALWSAPPPWLAACAGALAGEAAAVLPVQAPGGFGSYEAAVAFAALPLAGRPLAELLASAWLVHLLVLAVACCGAALAALAPRAPLSMDVAT